MSRKEMKLAVWVEFASKKKGDQMAALFVTLR